MRRTEENEKTVAEIERPPFVKDKHLEYLDALRESGITNMFGASPYVQRAYRMSKANARATLIYWMRTFSQRHVACATEDRMRREQPTYDERTMLRFWSHVQKTDSCWLWTGPKNTFGYGRFFALGLAKDTGVAHRFAFQVFVRPLQQGECVMHVCDVPACVNPDHLRAGGYLENNRDMFHKRRAWQTQKTACPSGHPYDEANTAVLQGRRYCRSCQRDERLLREAQQRDGSYVVHKRVVRRARRLVDGVSVEVFTPRSRADSHRFVRVAVPGTHRSARKMVPLADFHLEYVYAEASG